MGSLLGVVLSVMIVEMMAMFIILMTNMSHLQFGEEGKRGQFHLEPSEDDHH